MPRPQFVLVAGPNGAGKSTFTQSIRQRFPNIEVIDPDAIARGITGTYATIDQEQFLAGKESLRLVNHHISIRQSLMVESTISGSTYFKYVRMAKEAGFRTVFIYVALKDAEMSAERVAKRVSLGGHTIPLHDIKRRFPRSLNNLKNFIKEFESSHIYDNSQQYRWVAAFRNGIIHKINQDVPVWLQSYIL